MVNGGRLLLVVNCRLKPELVVICKSLNKYTADLFQHDSQSFPDTFIVYIANMIKGTFGDGLFGDYYLSAPRQMKWLKTNIDQFCKSIESLILALLYIPSFCIILPLIGTPMIFDTHRGFFRFHGIFFQ